MKTRIKKISKFIFKEEACYIQWVQHVNFNGNFYGIGYFNQVKESRGKSWNERMRDRILKQKNG